MATRWPFELATSKPYSLKLGAARLGVELGAAAWERLGRYQAELMKWNRRINLIARETTENQVVENHFLDSLTLVPFLLSGPKPVHLLDVGTGAGFPGLVLACALPEIQVTLMEPRQKRVTFLKHIIRLIDLANATVVAERVEQAAMEWQGLFTHITSRAVAEPGLFLPLIRALATPETRVILMLARQEMLAGIENLASGGWRIERTCALNLPFSQAPRFLAEVKIG